ncbi:PIR protein [Plasmodium vivax]|uniref:VIR protein n=1 Tax=Plasmodium vivax TaxID=5855 RepID=A0A564ZMX7_PLAVI|nr:PIR protein [Plasmodium vivax]
MAALDTTELEKVFEILSLDSTYEKFENEESISSYDNECVSLGTEGEKVKKLCKIFLKNIQNLPNFQNNPQGHNLQASYLAYWVIHKLSEIFPNNSKNGVRDTIINFIGKGNEKYLELNKKHLFSNSDFDYERSREEKYLNEYFNNYNKIEKCPADKYETCEKYLTYIISIYEEHKKDCLGNECHYFSYNPQYDPNDLLYKLKNKIRATDAKENVVLAENNVQSLDANNSQQNMKMIIKYMSCTEIKDDKGNVYAYKCEDPAYRRYKERVYRRGSMKREVISSESVSNVIKKIGGLSCKEVTYPDSNNSKILLCNNPKIKEMKGEATSISNTNTVVAKEKTNENTVHSHGSNAQIAYENLGKNDHLDRYNMYPGVTLLASNRSVSEFKYENENTETQTNSKKGKYDFLTTVYHEFKEDELKDYFEKPKVICSNSSSDKDKTNCVKVAQTYNSQEIRQGDSMIYSEGTEFMNMGFADSFRDKLNLLKSSNVRIAVMGFLIAGTIFIFFLYFKFTPFGFWLRKKVFKEKRMNNIIYDEHMMNYPVHNSQPKHVNHNRKRIKIAYQAN